MPVARATFQATTYSSPTLSSAQVRNYWASSGDHHTISGAFAALALAGRALSAGLVEARRVCADARTAALLNNATDTLLASPGCPCTVLV